MQINAVSIFLSRGPLPPPSPSAATAGALPVYVQVSELLIRDIAAGRLSDGARLPPEREMAAELGIAVGTLRKALQVLTDKGLLERIQGSGNYIRQCGPVESVYAMFRLELPGGGGLPRAEVIGVDYLEKPATLPVFGTCSMATRIRRRRYLNDIQVAVEEIWLDASAGKVDAAALSDSLYEYYKKVLGFWITRAEDRVGVAPVPDWADGIFSLPKGAPAGVAERFSWASAAIPIEFSYTYFDSARARYVQRLR